MKNKVVIDYTKVPQGTYKDFLNFKEKSYKENVDSMKDYIESINHSLNWDYLNWYVDKEETVRFIDCIDFEKSKIYIEVEPDKIDLAHKQTQKILQTQEIMMGGYQLDSFFSKGYMQKTKEIIKSSKQFTIIENRENIKHLFNMLKVNEISNVKVDIVGGNNIEELKSIIEVIKENEDILLQNNIKLNKCEYENCETIGEVDEVMLDSMFYYFDKGTVLIGNKENSYAQPMDCETYRLVREKLDDIVKDIPKDLPRKDKFKIIYTRIAEKISYDYEALDNKDEEKKNTARNLIGGLLHGKSICAGYAEILKQACSLVGIPCRFIVSEVKEGECSHAYNVVEYELGKWANADITLDCKNIRDEKKVKNALKSDKDFRKVKKENRMFHEPESYEKLRQLFGGVISKTQEVPKCFTSIELYPEYNLPKPIRGLMNRIKKVNPKNIFKFILKDQTLQLSGKSEAFPVEDVEDGETTIKSAVEEEKSRKKTKKVFTKYLSNMENFDQSTREKEKIKETNTRTVEGNDQCI